MFISDQGNIRDQNKGIYCSQKRIIQIRGLSYLPIRALYTSANIFWLKRYGFDETTTAPMWQFNRGIKT